MRSRINGRNSSSGPRGLFSKFGYPFLRVTFKSYCDNLAALEVEIDTACILRTICVLGRRLGPPGLKTRQWITVLLIEPPTSPVSNKGCYLVFSQGVPYAFEAGSQDRQEEIT